MDPPAQVTSAPYRSWLQSVNATPSPFFDLMFQWYAAQLAGALPNGVAQDPQKLFIDVNTALRQTRTMEANGDIDEYTTVGFDAYALVNAPIDKALETALFYCGKPVGKPVGDTYPFDSVFGRSHGTIQVKWGPGNYLFSLSDTNGGIVSDLHDDFALLVRGNATDGYVLFSSFLGATAGADTATSSHISIMMLGAAPGNTTALRHGLRRTGQNYGMAGPTFGFNQGRIRTAEAAFTAAMIELNSTGKIRENRP